MIRVRNNNVESALRILKRRYSDKMFEYREREHFEKPSAKRNKSKKSAIIRERKRKNVDTL